MQGSPAVIETLNELLTAELTAINQYFIHAKMCENWGYDRLAEKIREESIDEMKRRRALIERILFLDGRAEPAAPEPGGGRRDRARAVRARPRPGARGHRPLQPGVALARPRATTAPASSSRQVSAVRRTPRLAGDPART